MSGKGYPPVPGPLPPPPPRATAVVAPVMVLRSATPLTEEQVTKRRASSLATISALLPEELLANLAYMLEAFAKERAHGSLSVSLNIHEGRVKSADFDRRTHWQAARNS